MKPNFLLIGAMKSATTSLFDILGCHPQVFVTNPKEPEFFCKDDIFARGWPWYESMFADADGGISSSIRRNGSGAPTRSLESILNLVESIRFPDSHVSAVKQIDDAVIRGLQRMPLARKLKNLAPGSAGAIMLMFRRLLPRRPEWRADWRRDVNARVKEDTEQFLEFCGRRDFWRIE